MFATFTSSMDVRGRNNPVSASTAATTNKPKRSRARERCRTCRLESGDGQPCRNCRNKGARCSNDIPCGDGAVTPAVNRELESLRARVAEFEGQQQQAVDQDTYGGSNAGTSSSASYAPAHMATAMATAMSTAVAPPEWTMVTPDSQRSSPAQVGATSLPSMQRGAKWRWPGIWIPDPRSGQPMHHGPTSINHFIFRMGTYLDDPTGKESPSQLFHVLQSFSASKALPVTGSADPLYTSSSLEQPITTGGDDHGMVSTNMRTGAMDGIILKRHQEEYLLSSFWESYHSTTPIVNEADFRKHYDSLWDSAGASWTPSASHLEPARKPSALVDVILALCMQHNMGTGTSHTVGGGQTFGQQMYDASDARGRCIFERSQRLLQAEINTPSLLNVQCHIYAAVYLMNIAVLNGAYRMLSIAIQAAYAIGIHLEASEDLLGEQRALSRRIWWTLLVLDTKLGLQLGQPPLIQGSDFVTPLPTNDQQEAAMAGASAAVYEDITWISFNTQCAMLVMATRGIWAAYNTKCSEAMSTHETSEGYDEQAQFEGCASKLSRRMEPIRDWIKNVPVPLRLPRKGSDGSRQSAFAFTPATCPVDVGIFVPLWLQRQRVLLELLFHNFIIHLHRPFIRFPSTRTASGCDPRMTPTVDSHAMAALSYATATINIIHQILTETDLLNSWHAAYRYLWEASLTLVGFSLSRPLCPFTASASKTIAKAIDTFEIFSGYGFTSAGRAAQIMRDLSVGVEGKSQSLRSTLSPNQNKQWDNTSNYGGGTTAPPPSLSTSLSSPEQASSNDSGSSASSFIQLQLPKSSNKNNRNNNPSTAQLPLDLLSDMLEYFDAQNQVMMSEWEPLELGPWPEVRG